MNSSGMKRNTSQEDFAKWQDIVFPRGSPSGDDINDDRSLYSFTDNSTLTRSMAYDSTSEIMSKDSMGDDSILGDYLLDGHGKDATITYEEHKRALMALNDRWESELEQTIRQSQDMLYEQQQEQAYSNSLLPASSSGNSRHTTDSESEDNNNKLLIKTQHELSQLKNQMLKKDSDLSEMKKYHREQYQNLYKEKEEVTRKRQELEEQLQITKDKCDDELAENRRKLDTEKDNIFSNFLKEMESIVKDILKKLSDDDSTKEDDASPNTSSEQELEKHYKIWTEQKGILVHDFKNRFMIQKSIMIQQALVQQQKAHEVKVDQLEQKVKKQEEELKLLKTMKEAQGKLKNRNITQNNNNIFRNNKNNAIVDWNDTYTIEGSGATLNDSDLDTVYAAGSPSHDGSDGKVNCGCLRFFH